MIYVYIPLKVTGTNSSGYSLSISKVFNCFTKIQSLFSSSVSGLLQLLEARSTTRIKYPKHCLLRSLMLSTGTRQLLLLQCHYVYQVLTPATNWNKTTHALAMLSLSPGLKDISEKESQHFAINFCSAFAIVDPTFDDRADPP